MNEKNIDIQTRADFNQVWGIITYHRQRVSKTVDDEGLRMIWEVGAYVSYKLRHSEWGTGVVRQLSEYIHTQDPTVKGWSYRTIYKMVQLYEAYSSESFTALLETTTPNNLIACQQMDSYSEIVPVETAQIDDAEFVPIQLAQIPNVLFSTGWSNHQLILNRCKTNEEYCKYMNM